MAKKTKIEKIVTEKKVTTKKEAVNKAETPVILEKETPKEVLEEISNGGKVLPLYPENIVSKEAETPIIHEEEPKPKKWITVNVSTEKYDLLKRLFPEEGGKNSVICAIELLLSNEHQIIVLKDKTMCAKLNDYIINNHITTASGLFNSLLNGK